MGKVGCDIWEKRVGGRKKYLIGRFVKGGRRLESPAKNWIEEECASVDVGGGGGVKGGRERTCVCERVVSDL